MKSYIKIYGPPTYKAIKALENIALDMPEVCIMDSEIYYGDAPLDTLDQKMAYFEDHRGFTRLPEEARFERCDTIISDSGEALGEYDFFFEWFKKPNQEELNMLIQKIDETLEPLDCRYTITTKE